MENSAKKVMLIGEKESFLIRVLLKKLKEADIEVVFVTTSIDDVQRHWPNTAVITYYLDTSEVPKPDLLQYLHDKLLDSGLRIALIGEKTDIQEAGTYLSDDLILGTFLRPLDTDHYIHTLSEHISSFSANNRRKSILVVDDDPTYLGVVRDWLREKYRVSIVGSGLQAIKWLGMNTADLILLDYEMPITSGPQVLEMLRSDPETRSIPVFFLTGKSDKESVMQVMALKPENYLLKSIDKDELLEKVNLFFTQT